MPPSNMFALNSTELGQLQWRILYAVFTGRTAETVVTWLLRGIGVVAGQQAPERVLGWIERRFAYSGWPYYGYGWMNLHVSRLTAGARRRVTGRSPRTVRRSPREHPRRIGCIGRFVALLGFPKELLEACPTELVVADIGYAGRHAAYLRDSVASYAAFDLDTHAGYDDQVSRIASFFAGANVDMVLNVGHKREAHDVIDLLDVPCIANYCAGSDLLHHPKVDIQYHGQPEADYFVRDGRMFCGTTGRFFSRQYVHTVTGYIDPRGLDFGAPRTWNQREPLIVCHGSLFKYASPPLLDILCGLLAADRRLPLAIVGKDDGKALSAIQARAAHWKVGGQVHYEGHFSAVRDEAGKVDAAGWNRSLDLLRRARLAPDPFPIGGGSARYEAYAMGVPSVHMGVCFDPAAWGRPQPGNCEIPSLLVRRGTAWSIEEYAQLCRQCLADAATADALALEQLERARIVGDASRWWREILDGYRQWQRGFGGEERAA